MKFRKTPVVLLSCLTMSAVAHSATPNTITVNVSEDAYAGNAQFTVSIDKKKVGGNLTTTELHSAGGSQDFALTGAWGPGPHTITVRYLTDAYGGSAAKDRNLYVNTVAYDGVASKVSDIEISRAGGVDFPILTAVAPVAPTAPVVPPVVAALFSPGVNLSGMEDNSGKKPGRANYDYAVIKPSEIDYYAAKGVKLIRLPILWERLQPNILAASPNYTLDPAYLKLVTTVLTYANTKGMGVVVDLHNYGNYNAIKMDTANGVTPAQFKTAWTAIAKALKPYPGLIGYDLMNEPNGFPDGSMWPAIAQAGITGIRASDMNTSIFVEGDAYAGAQSWTNHGANLISLVDPAKKIVYEAHVYGDRDSSGTHFTWNQEEAAGVSVNTIAERLAPFDSWCKTNKLTCMIGEVGVGNDNANWNTELANAFVQMKADGLIGVTYWAGGPWWGSNYPMSIEPLNGADRLQMTVLSKFITTK